MDKQEIASILGEMGTLLELQGANPFKARAFQNAARAVEAMTEDIGTVAADGRLQDVKGIGKSIAAIVGDLVSKGASAEYEELRRQTPDGLLEMLKIEGLGPKRILMLHRGRSIRTVKELEDACKAGRICSLKGFGARSEKKIIEGIAALRERGSRVLFPVAERAATAILEHVRGLPQTLQAEIAGSIRRRKETIGDVDILVAAKDRDREAIMKAFLAHPLLATVTAHGTTKSSAVLREGIPCDMRIVKEEEFPFAFSYFTGSKEHNIVLRGRARQIGWSLNEYGFSRVEGAPKHKSPKIPQCRSEKDIYKALGLAWVPPELREDRGEVDAAAKGPLPRLVEYEDIRGTLHCHTTFSDGLHSLEQMGNAAKQLGWEFLGIADHSKAAAYAGGLTASDVKRQFREIDTLNARLPVQLLKGTECDILADGTLDWPEHMLAGFEYVVVSVHSAFQMSERDMTRRIIKALKQKHVTMLGHPTGRLLLAREGYPVNMEEVIAAAADYGTMIEINAHPTRLDLDWRLCRFARDKGVLLSVNPDAHSIDDLSNVRFGVNIARKGWLTKGDVLNTRSCAEVLKLVRK